MAVFVAQLFDPVRLISLLLFAYFIHLAIRYRKWASAILFSVFAIVGIAVLMHEVTKSIAFSGGRYNRSIDDEFNPFKEPYVSKIPYGEYALFSTVYNRENFDATAAIIERRYRDCLTILGYDRPNWRTLSPPYTSAMSQCRNLSYISGVSVGVFVIASGLFALNAKAALATVLQVPRLLYWAFIRFLAAIGRRQRKIKRDIQSKMDD